MDDFGSGVVGSVHEVGAWRGPARRPWLRRIVNGAGFTRDWDESRLVGGVPEEPDPVPASYRDARDLPAPEAFTAESLRLWWLPRAHEP